MVNLYFLLVPRLLWYLDLFCRNISRCLLYDTDPACGAIDHPSFANVRPCVASRPPWRAKLQVLCLQSNFDVADTSALA